MLKIRYGKAIATDQRTPDGPIPVVGSAGRMTGTSRPLTPGPAVVIGRKGNIGSVLLELDGCWPIDTTYYAAVPSSFDPKFLAYQLSAAEMHRLNSSTTTPSLRREDLEAQSVLVPPIAEQRRIVEILEEHLSHLDAAEKLVMVAQRRSRAVTASMLERTRARAGGTLVRLRDIATDARYGTSVKCEVDGPGPAVIRIPNLVKGSIDLTDEKRARDADVDLSAVMVETGDLLFVRTNGSRDLIGRTAVVQGGVVAAFASYLIRFQVDGGRVDPYWVMAMMGAPSTRQVIESMAASSAGQYNLSLAKLGALELPLPSIQLQKQMLAKASLDVDAVKSITAGLNLATRRSAALRRSLLAAAFSGRLTGRPIDAEIIEEMASV